MVTEKKVIDWELVEKLYRAGVKTLREIGSDHGVSHVAIQKRAKKEGWTRDLSKKVQEKAKELVTKDTVTKAVTAQEKVTEQQVVSVLAQKVADIDLTNRSDLQSGLDVIRGMTHELGELSRPEFRERLEWVGEVMDQTFETDSGRVIKDKVNELYMYIIGLQGRIKMAKDLAAAVGTYIPLQRKVVGLDADKAAGDIDDLLLRIARERSGA